MLKNELEMLVASLKIKDPSHFESIEHVADYNNISIDKTKKAYIDENLKIIKSKKINVVNYFSRDYPESLKLIEYPPLVLFYVGTLKAMELPISIVGTRYPSGYGERVVQYLIKPLVDSGFSTISGMARGVDALVHKTTIYNKGYTIAVLGSGINVIYPKENEKLYEIIKETGCVMSEFPIGEKPNKFNFPYRNRIIAGLSKATIVVEADTKSGSLITARLATEQSKTVFAVPGDIFSRRSRGTNKLISDGAYLLSSIDDILSYFYLEIRKEIKFIENKTKINLDDDEKLILGTIEGDVDFDILVQKTNMNPDKVSEVLFDLQIKGLIRDVGANRFEKV